MDSSAFADGTHFKTTVVLDTASATAYGEIEFNFKQGDYPDLHTADVDDIAGALRDLFLDRGYTITPFTAPVTSSADLDWPEA